MLMQNRTMSPEQLAVHAEAVARKKGPVLIFEGRVGIRWQALSMQCLGDPPATISNNMDGVRDIYVTQTYGDRATISKLPPGVDVEQGRQRIIDAEDLKLAQVMHVLMPGDAVELTLRPDRAPAPKLVRYRYEAAKA